MSVFGRTFVKLGLRTLNIEDKGSGGAGNEEIKVGTLHRVRH